MVRCYVPDCNHYSDKHTCILLFSDLCNREALLELCDKVLTGGATRTLTRSLPKKTIGIKPQRNIFGEHVGGRPTPWLSCTSPTMTGSLGTCTASSVALS